MKKTNQRKNWFKEQIKLYTKLLKQSPDNSYVLEKRALCHYNRRDWEKAVLDFEELVKRFPGNATFWSYLGQACVHTKLSERAIEACSRAIEIDWDDSISYMHRAWAYKQMKNYDAAIAGYTKALDLYQENHKTMHRMDGRNTLRSALYRGQLYMELCEYQKAMDDFLYYVEILRNNDGYFRLGKVLLKMKMYEKLIEYFNKYEYDYYHPLLVKQKVIAYKKLGLKEKAEALLNRFMEYKKFLQDYENEDRERHLQQQEEIKQRMAVKAPHLYNKYQSASTLSTVGMCMTLGGLAIGTIGLAVADTETNAYTGETTYSGPGGAIGAIGMTCALVGTPIWIVGGVKKKKIRNSYLHLQQFDYSFHTPHSSPYLQVTTAPNKLGLALIF